MNIKNGKSREGDMMENYLQTMMALSYIPVGEMILRLTVAALCAFALGFERESNRKSFGLRTHMLLCIGTAAFVLILMEMVHSQQPEVVEIDIARVIQGVIIGIGFLAAGSIFRPQQTEQIKGATTGAGIWVLGAIGLACGVGLYVHAILITTLVLFVVVILHPLDKVIKHSPSDPE